MRFSQDSDFDFVRVKPETRGVGVIGRAVVMGVVRGLGGGMLQEQRGKTRSRVESRSRDHRKGKCLA